MKTHHTNQTRRFFFTSIILLTLMIVIAGINGFRTAASNDAKPVSVNLKSPNTPAINLRPGRDLPTVYASGDNSSNELRAGGNRRWHSPTPILTWTAILIW